MSWKSEKEDVSKNGVGQRDWQHDKWFSSHVIRWVLSSRYSFTYSILIPPHSLCLTIPFKWFIKRHSYGCIEQKCLTLFFRPSDKYKFFVWHLLLIRSHTTYIMAAVAQWGQGVVLQPQGCRFDPRSPHKLQVEESMSKSLNPQLLPRCITAAHCSLITMDGCREYILLLVYLYNDNRLNPIQRSYNQLFLCKKRKYLRIYSDTKSNCGCINTSLCTSLLTRNTKIQQSASEETCAYSGQPIPQNAFHTSNRKQ